VTEALLALLALLAQQDPKDYRALQMERLSWVVGRLMEFKMGGAILRLTGMDTIT
jgi:hypothetical protein